MLVILEVHLYVHKLRALFWFSLVVALAVHLSADELPTVHMQNGASQLLLRGKPFLVLGGELGNSSAGTAEQADAILPELARLHFNTVLMPVAWNQIEPKEGAFNFSILDHWIVVARQQHLHLILLWFGTWKNAFSNYAPTWVLSDAKRFPRAVSSEGLPLQILSPLGTETLQCDKHAFAALMHHVRVVDAEQQTILMVQVENEIGYLGVGGRDRSALANRLFLEAVPERLKAALVVYSETSQNRWPAGIRTGGKTWSEVFGQHADEAFMAWYYGRFVGQVTAAGKTEYALPMYMNAQLPAAMERAGEYPSGGPYPLCQKIYRVAAPGVDFYSPDIYWPDFEFWIEQYQAEGNPVFVPEARIAMAPMNSLYVYGEARGFGFSPFGVDSLTGQNHEQGTTELLSDEYAALGQMQGTILRLQQSGLTRGLVLHKNSPRPMQTISLGGYLFQASLDRAWPDRSLLATDGAMMVMEISPGEFYVLGSGLTVDFLRDPDTDQQFAGVASIEQMAYRQGRWVAVQRLNGDQTNQGRQLLMDPHAFHVYRVQLYTYAQSGGGKN